MNLVAMSAVQHIREEHKDTRNFEDLLQRHDLREGEMNRGSGKATNFPFLLDQSSLLTPSPSRRSSRQSYDMSEISITPPSLSPPSGETSPLNSLGDSNLDHIPLLHDHLQSDNYNNRSYYDDSSYGGHLDPHIFSHQDDSSDHTSSQCGHTHHDSMPEECETSWTGSAGLSSLPPPQQSLVMTTVITKATVLLCSV